MSTLPVSFADRVREKINGQIADLITEEEMKKLVDARVGEFLRSELPALVTQCLKERATEVIKAEFAKPEWQPKWDNFGQYAASEMISEIIEKSAGKILTGMIGSAVSMAVHQFQNGGMRY